MNENELRAGNIVKMYRHIKVSSNMIFDVTSDEKSLLDDRFESILLNDDWLSILGFIESIEDTFAKHSLLHNIDFELQRNNSGYYFFTHSSEPTVVKYVHQLQNLYFAVTGEELIVNHEDKENMTFPF